MRNVIAQMGSPDIWMPSFRENISSINVEDINADLSHDIPTLAHRSRCFLRKLESLQAVLAVFVQAYNRFGLQKGRYRFRH